MGVHNRYPLISRRCTGGGWQVASEQLCKVWRIVFMFEMVK